MPKDPDDIFGPDDKVPKGPVIDVTPGKKGKVAEEEVPDFESGRPLAEQAIERQGLKRIDKTKKEGCLGRIILLLSLVFLASFFLILFLVRLI